MRLVAIAGLPSGLLCGCQARSGGLGVVGLNAVAPAYVRPAGPPATRPAVERAPDDGYVTIAIEPGRRVFIRSAQGADRPQYFNIDRQIGDGHEIVELPGGATVSFPPNPLKTYQHVSASHARAGRDRARSRVELYEVSSGRVVIGCAGDDGDFDDLVLTFTAGRCTAGRCAERAPSRMIRTQPHWSDALEPS